MQSLLSWVRKNAVFVLIIVVLLGVMYFQNGTNDAVQNRQLSVSDYSYSNSLPSAFMPIASLGEKVGFSPDYEAAPTSGSPRMIVSDSYLSLVVKDVTQSVEQIKQYAQSLGGYFVNSEISRPEEGGTGTITLRIPIDKLEEAIASLKSQAVQVVSERLEGRDVTDQYVNNEERLRILEANKARFEEIMTLATDVSEIIRVQREIFSLQSEIDSIVGQQTYLEQTASMAKVTLYVSTDELSLPYSPENAWRPDVVFKTAVRSLIGTVRSLGSLAIWIAVYAVVWAPVLLVVWFIHHKKRRKTT